MAKSTTKPIKHAAPNRKLTDFFTPHVVGASSSSPPSSSPMPITGAIARTKLPTQSNRAAAATTKDSATKHEIISVDSRSASRVSISSDSTNIHSVTCISSDSHTSSAPHVTPKSTRYRPHDTANAIPRTPELQIICPPRNASPTKVSKKRKQIFDLDPDVEVLNTVIYVPQASIPTPAASKENIPTGRQSPAKPSPSKRQKSRSIQSINYVPSSQSDEQELVAPGSPRDLNVVKESINRWRTATERQQTPTLPAMDTLTPEDMDIEPSYAMNAGGSLPSPNSEAGGAANSVVRSSATLLTPASSEKAASSSKGLDDYRPLSPPPSDPAPMDADQLIAKMKADALAEASKEEERSINMSISFSDSSESESDDDVFGLRDSPKNENISARVPQTRASRSPNASRRSRRLMERSPSPVGSTSTPFINNVSYRSRQRNAPSKGPVILTTGVAKKPRSSNPLKKLLQQKQKADSYAFLDELSDTDDDLDLLGIDLLAVASSEGEMDVDSAGARVAQLLGSKDGKAVGKILTHDRNHHIKNVKVVGIEFFTHEHKSAPPATRSTYIAKLEGEDFNDAVFNVFKNAVHVNDATKVQAILDTGLLARVKPHNLGDYTRWLVDQVFCSHETNLEDSAVRALSLLLSSGCSVNTKLLATVLSRLGADLKLMVRLGLKTASDAEPVNFSNSRRILLTRRWVCVVGNLAQHCSLENGAEVIVMLALVAVDTTSSSDLRHLAAISIDHVGQKLSPDLELTACNKLAKLSAELSPTNQALLISLFVGGCAPVARVSRWLSLAVLLGPDVLPKDKLDHPLPMMKILRLLCAPYDSGEMFDVQNSDMDYEDLACQINILAASLTDIDQQVRVEREDKNTATLDVIYTQLSTLHGKIVDTRAAHLDRSRAKAALQNLSFRVRYQTIAAQSVNTKSRPKTMDKYFVQK